ncbi:MAG: serine/threonine protein kinase [Deltaproteobacteria bacterium]|nr:serine/threonine protein kinase [Deltaproteobacteria bacterium]
MLAVVADRYHLVAPLRSGGMGSVYDAVHSGTGRRVAVKLLRAELASNERSRTRFVREARLAGGLDSPYVAEVLDAGTDETSGLPYIAMELLEGDDLRGHLARRGRLPAGLALVIGAHVAAGLAAAHEAGVIHRDVKPANVVLCSDKRGDLLAKLIDFGVAKAPADDDESVTETGALVGSLPYMSPEQLRGQPIDARTDLWSLGVVLYEAIAGVRPTGTADAVAEIVLRACGQGFPRLEQAAPGVPAEVAELVHRALRVDPDERFSTAKEMHGAILALLDGNTTVPATLVADGGDAIAITSRRIEAVHTVPPPARPPWRTLVGVAGAGLAAAMVTIAVLRAGSSASAETSRATTAVDAGVASAAEAPSATIAAASAAATSGGGGARGVDRGPRTPAITPGRAKVAPRAKASSDTSKDPLSHM